MLLMTLEEVKHGICLFQTQNQAEWVLLIKERIGKEKIIVHDIANDGEWNGMVTSQDFRKWASESDADVVVVCSMQLLGMRYGDEEAVEKLNFMRDQILAIGKLFVFGVSPYFNLLLPRGERDLYSCILHHFVLQDAREKRRSCSQGIDDYFNSISEKKTARIHLQVICHINTCIFFQI